MPRSVHELSAALERTLGRFARLVHRIGVRHRLSEDDVDDLMQEVRIRLWRACASGEQITKLGSSYVYRTATTAAVDLLRRRRGSTDAMDERTEQSPSPAATPEEAAQSAELGALILRMMEALPVARRTVVRMYLAGYERDQIADLLGWTEAKTRNLLYRGLTELRTRLAAEGARVPT